MNVGSVIRLKSAIEGTLREEGSGATSADALTDADARFRQAIAELARDDAALMTEFESLYPPTKRKPGGDWAGADMVDAAAAAKSARTRLSGMAGWLQGVIDTNQIVLS